MRLKQKEDQKMINEPTLNGFIPKAPVQDKIKTEESNEIARLVDEYLKRGGKITQVGNVNKLDKQGRFIAKNEAYTFDELPKVLKAMSDKKINTRQLADAVSINKKLIDLFLSGKRIPDKIEKDKILAFLIAV